MIVFIEYSRNEKKYRNENRLVISRGWEVGMGIKGQCEITEMFCVLTI